MVLSFLIISRNFGYKNVATKICTAKTFLKRLMKDYLDIEGASLPETFKKLGYKNWSDPRLISDFGDTFFCNGNTVYAVQKGRSELSLMIAKTKTKSSK